MERTGLVSALPDTITTQKCYQASNFKMIKRKIDYVFYDSKRVALTFARSLDKEVEQNPFGCPCKECPSDHLPLFTHFQWTDLS
jgi:mRNA deadenylase 3'-5' endonuclease subunit Ccr4